MENEASTILIDGQWRPAGSGATFPVTDPATAEVIGYASDGDAHDVQAAIASASTAFETWSQTTAYERAAVLTRAHGFFRSDTRSSPVCSRASRASRCARRAPRSPTPETSSPGSPRRQSASAA